MNDQTITNSIRAVKNELGITERIAWKTRMLSETASNLASIFASFYSVIMMAGILAVIGWGTWWMLTEKILK